jgi:hypothetical protein
LLEGGIPGPSSVSILQVYDLLNQAIGENWFPGAIAALSEGTTVVDRELAYLATDPAAPPANALQFVMFSSPELGLAHVYLPNGFTVPLIDYTVQGLPDTRYNASVVFGQYDFWGNPPDRPWNLLADVNSLFGRPTTTTRHHSPRRRTWWRCRVSPTRRAARSPRT